MSLEVLDTLSREGDEDVIPLLETFLNQAHRYILNDLDVFRHVLCNASVEDALGQPTLCSRLCQRVLCSECDINRCGWCRSPPVNNNRFNGDVLCLHMCADCGEVSVEGLRLCTACADNAEPGELTQLSHRMLCRGCLGRCDGEGCGASFCMRYCIGTTVTSCPWCGTFYCEACSTNFGWVYCSQCSDSWCGGPTCGVDVQVVVQSAADWVAKLQEREGGVDAAVVERLLELVPADEEDDDGYSDQICMYCIDKSFCKILDAEGNAL